MLSEGFPAVALWVKKPTEAARVTVVVWLDSRPGTVGSKSSITTAVVEVTAVARIQSLAWELPCASGAATKKKKNT